MAIESLQILKQRTLSIPEKAKEIIVNDQQGLTIANGFLLGIKTLAKEISDTFDPLIKKAYEAHKAILDQKKKYEEPLIQGEKIIKPRIAAYLTEQERLRREAEEKAKKEKEEAERKAREEEEKRLQAAIAAEEAGDKAKAEAILNQEPEKKEETKIIIPEKPITEGIAMKEVWKWKIVDEKLIPRQFLKIDEVKVNELVRSLKGQLQIPGIQIYSEKVIAAGFGR